MKTKGNGIFQTLTKFCVELMHKYLPDAFIFAAFLTIIVFFSVMIFTNQSFLTTVNHWGNGVWSLLAFSMQMVVVLVAGHTLAIAPLFKKGLNYLSNIPKTPKQAILAVSLVSGAACLINWGFGLVIGAIYAKELAKKIKNLDYPLLIAAAYGGFLLWHAGISGSIPLALASGNLEKITAGAISNAIPTSETIFSKYNLIIVIILYFTMPFIYSAMHPKNQDEIISVDPNIFGDDTKIENISKKSSITTPSDWIENSRFINIIIGILGYSYIIKYFIERGFDLNLNIVNMIFLISAIVLHGTPKKLLSAFSEAIKGAGGIVLQFPFYAGIMGMMTGSSVGGVSLAALISEKFVSFSTSSTFPIFTFLSAGIVNFFVPSGGGQWAVQAPIMMPASNLLNVNPAKTAMAIAWGDAWTNMIQPFWALPALGIAKLGAKDIMGYGIIILIYSGIIISLGLFLI